jgi:hypothetical protein
MHAEAKPASHIRGWLVASGLGLLAGALPCMGGTGAGTQVHWLALAGFALGIACAYLAPAREVLATMWGTVAAVATAVAMMAAAHYQSGFWPIADEVRIVQYGSTAQALVRVVVLLGGVVGVPSLLAAGLVAAARRRAARRRGCRA